MGHKIGFDHEYKIEGDIGYFYVINKKGERFEIIVDAEDIDKLKKLNYRWNVRYDPQSKNHYSHSVYYYDDENGKKKQTTLCLHAVILDVKTGETIDHINHNTLDNRKENLRVISQTNNLRHRKGANCNSKSGYRNVCWLTREKKWCVQLNIDGTGTRLAKFKKEDLDKAIDFAEKMREKYYGEYKGFG